MFTRPTSTEAALLCRGLAALLVIVVLGVLLAENQLNNLTQRNEFVQAINIKRDNTGKYSLYLLGTEYSIRAVYDVARISDGDREVVIEAAGHKFLIPKSLDFNRVKLLCSLWQRQFINEAFEFKKAFEVHIREFRQEANYYIERYRQQLR